MLNMLIPNLALYGVFTYGLVGPHAMFSNPEWAKEWAKQMFGEGEYEIHTTYSLWITKQEHDKIEEFYGNTAE